MYLNDGPQLDSSCGQLCAGYCIPLSLQRYGNIQTSRESIFDRLQHHHYTNAHGQHQQHASRIPVPTVGLDAVVSAKIQFDGQCFVMGFFGYHFWILNSTVSHGRHLHSLRP